MSISVSNTNIATDSVSTLIENQNRLATAMSNNVVTAGAGADGLTTGNAHVAGTLSTEDLRSPRLGGGNTSVSANLTITSNTVMNGANTTINSNTIFNASATFNLRGTERLTISDSTRMVFTGVGSNSFMKIGTGGVVQFSNDITDVANIEATNITATGDLTVQGNTTISSGQTFNADDAVANSLRVENQSDFRGNTALGDASTDLISINGKINTNVIPSDNSYNIGSVSARWGDIYVGDINLSANLVYGSNTVIFAGKIHANNAIADGGIPNSKLVGTTGNAGEYGSNANSVSVTIDAKGFISDISETPLQRANSSALGVASFDENHFSVDNGDVELAVGVPTTIITDTVDAPVVANNNSLRLNGDGTVLVATVSRATGGIQIQTRRADDQGGIGTAAFSNTDFDISTNGFVELADNIPRDITGNNGITAIADDSGVIDISIPNANSTQKGVASFNSDDFDVNATGNVALASGVVKSITGGDGINSSGSGHSRTISAVDASHTVKGVARYDADHFNVSTGNVEISFFDSDEGIDIPIGTDAERPAVARPALLRWNRSRTENQLEIGNGTGYDEVLVSKARNVSTNRIERPGAGRGPQDAYIDIISWYEWIGSMLFMGGSRIFKTGENLYSNEPNNPVRIWGKLQRNTQQTLNFPIAFPTSIINFNINVIGDQFHNVKIDKDNSALSGTWTAASAAGTATTGGVYRPGRKDSIRFRFDGDVDTDGSGYSWSAMGY